MHFKSSICGRLESAGLFLSLFLILICGASAAEKSVEPFLAKHCVECHDAETKKGNLDLTSLQPDFADAENFARCGLRPMILWTFFCECFPTIRSV